MLEDIVKDDELGRRVAFKELLDAFHAFFAHGKGNVGKLKGEHRGFVAETGGAMTAVVKDEA